MPREDSSSLLLGKVSKVSSERESGPWYAVFRVFLWVVTTYAGMFLPAALDQDVQVVNYTEAPQKAAHRSLR